MSTPREHASRSLLWSCVDTFGQTGFSLLALVILARLCTIEEIGNGSLAVMLAQLVAMPLELLFHDALIQRRELRDSHIDSALLVTLAGGLLGMTVLLLLVPAIASQYAQPALAPLLYVTALTVPFAGTTAIISALLRRQLAFAPFARRTLIARLVGVSLGVLVAVRGYGAWALVAMYVASTVLSTLTLCVEWRHHPSFTVSRDALRELWRFAGPNLLSQLLLLANGRVFIMLSAFYLGAADFGRLSVAYRIVEEMRNTLSAAASQLALPLLSLRVDQPGKFAALFAEATAFTAALLVPLYAGMFVTATDLMQVVFGLKWLGAAAAVQLFALASVLLTLRQYASIATNALGKPGVNVAINGAAFTLSMILLCSGWVTDSAAAAEVWLWRAGILLAASLIGTRQVAKLTIAAQLAPSTPPLLAALAMCVGIILFQHTGAFAHSSALRLGVAVALGVIIYVITLIATSPTLATGLSRFARSALIHAK